MSPYGDADQVDLLKSFIGDPEFEAEVASAISSDARIARIRDAANRRIAPIERAIRIKLARQKAAKLRKEFLAECRLRAAPVIGNGDTKRFS